MGIFFRYIFVFLRKDFQLGIYTYTAVFLSLALYLNYRYNFETEVLRKLLGEPWGFLYALAFYGFIYYGVCIPKLFASKKLYVLADVFFWLRTLFFISVVAGGISFQSYFQLSILKEFIDFSFSKEEFRFVSSNFSNLKLVLLWFLPILLFYFFFERSSYEHAAKLKPKPFLYGITFRNFKLRLYFFLMLFMLPLILFATSLQPFLLFYPIFDAFQIQPVFQLSPLAAMLSFELIYGMLFVCTELLFRGAFVIGFSDGLAEDSVLPMAALYCSIHFGKPVLEAISSIFGGYILGILAFYTLSIMGGIVVHIWIAWLTDALALLKKYADIGLPKSN